jgi:hypothetical protein
VQTAAVGAAVKQLEVHSEICAGVKAIQLARLKLPEITVAAQQASTARKKVKNPATKGARDRVGIRA